MPQPVLSEPVVSLVICTRNRARQLQACLAAVGKIRCRQPWEMVIVDNGSGDDTRALAQAFLRDNKPRQFGGSAGSVKRLVGKRVGEA
jgi:glycosyltransferase involved in cell wall biosynthesis